jgi:hypothetical protein
MMSSDNFHKNQYEQGRDDYSNSSLRKKILTGMRAVLQNYISREESGTAGGMGKFDTLIHDRTMEWRIYERNRKIKKFSFYFVATFFIVPIMIMYGAFDTWLQVGTFSIGVFVVSWLLQYGKTIAIRGHAATDTPTAKEGVRKAIADIWFETILSVKLSYLYAIILLIVWAGLGYFFGSSLGEFFLGWTNLLLSFFNFELYAVNPNYLVALVFILNLSSLLGDYLFWKILYNRRVPRREG